MNAMNRVMLGFAACLLTVSLASAFVPEDRVVEINDKGFSPDRLEVKVGEKVIWKNYALKDHTVTARVKPAAPDAQDKEKPLFDSGPIKPGDFFEYTFSKEGTFEYGCTMQKGMSGYIIVRAAR